MNVLDLLALLPRGLTTFLFALAALLRFYGHDTPEFTAGGVQDALLGWSLAAFLLATAALLADLGLEWHRRSRDRDQRTTRDMEARRRTEETLRRTLEEVRRATQGVRLQIRCSTRSFAFQLNDTATNRAGLNDCLALLREYGGLD
jgi:hypothetical protein